MARSRNTVLAAALAFVALPLSAQISDDVVKVGVLTDMTGAYSDLAGPGSVVAAQIAPEDFGGKVLGKPLGILSSDHQNKADVASNDPRKWFDDVKIYAIPDLVSRPAALLVVPLAADDDR